MRRGWSIGLWVLSLAACQSIRCAPYGWWQAISVAGRSSCVGVAIDAEWVVTVRHCVQRQGDRDPIPLEELTMTDQDETTRKVLRVVLPAGPYNHLGDIAGKDVALLKVDRPIAAVAGLGTWPGQHGNVLLLSRDDRIVATRIELRPFNGQGVYSRGVTCVGDSGSPVLDSNGNVAGLASWRSEPSCDHGISVFTRLDIFRDWIEANVT